MKGWTIELMENFPSPIIASAVITAEREPKVMRQTPLFNFIFYFF